MRKEDGELEERNAAMHLGQISSGPIDYTLSLVLGVCENTKEMEELNMEIS